MSQIVGFTTNLYNKLGCAYIDSAELFYMLIPSALILYYKLNNYGERINKLCDYLRNNYIDEIS